MTPSMLSALFGALSLSLALTAHAEFTGPGSHPAATSLTQVLAKPVDKQPVLLQGRLLRQLDKDLYLFSDGRHEVRVDIDARQFPPSPVGVNDLVEIRGHVDHDLLEPLEIEVSAMRVLTPARTH